MNDIIRTQNLCKHYKETIALDNVSLHIPRGAIYGLIGNNGAGKTTLMRILSNLQSPSSGTVVKSENIKIGAIIETPALYPTLSAKGNLKYQLKICGWCYHYDFKSYLKRTSKSGKPLWFPQKWCFNSRILFIRNSRYRFRNFLLQKFFIEKQKLLLFSKTFLTT